MNIDWTPLDLPGCFSTSLPSFGDARGSFNKLYHQSDFAPVVPGLEIREAYLTISQKGVLRGMHFQRPPEAHQKVVCCVGGRVLDVMLDLRPGRGYGHATSVEMTPQGTNCVAIPIGVAHGFLALEDDAALMYFVGTEYVPEADAGVLWNSFGFDWPLGSVGQDDPTLSDRDKGHPTLADFVPPIDWVSLK